MSRVYCIRGRWWGETSNGVKRRFKTKEEAEQFAGILPEEKPAVEEVEEVEEPFQFPLEY